MSAATTEQRLQTLEAHLANLQRQIDERLPAMTRKTERGWKAIVGTFADDPLYDEAMRLGREWRESQFDAPDTEMP